MKLLLKKITYIIISAAIVLMSSSSVYSQTATLEPTMSLVDVGGAKIPYQNGFPLPTFEKQASRTIIDLAGDWKKQRFHASDTLTLAKRDAAGLANIITEAANRQLSSYDDSNWELKKIPGVENKLNAAPTPPEFYTDGIWYRRTFNVDAANAGKFVKLYFYEVNYVCDVWINDKYVGYHEGGYTSFAFDVSSFLNYGSANTIALRVDNIAWSKRNDIVPYTYCDWFNYSGIMHDVFLEIASSVSVVRTNVVPQDISGNFQTSVVLLNKRTQSANVSASIKVYEASINQNNIQSEFAKDIAGSEVTLSGTTQNTINVANGSASVWNTNLKITNPKLWTPKQPNLYVMKVTITEGANVIDEYYTQFGIRKAEVLKGKFALNNKTMFLPGVARHEEHPLYGRSVPKDIIYSDLTKIKGLNALYLRTAHYPNHPYTYLMADRLGLAIMEEIPVWQFDTPESFNIQNNLRHIHQQMFREMVFRDYNRPSIIMWSTSNECKEETGRLEYHNTIKSDYRTNYNDGRLLTQSAAADRPGVNDPTMAPLDIVGWTMYFGVFYPREDLNAFGRTYTFLNDGRDANPNKPIIATEFGYWSSENGSKTADQVTIFNDTFKAYKYHAPYDAFGVENSSGYLMGVTWWCVFDWYQYRVNGYQTMGLISMDRQTEKPVVSALRSTYAPYVNLDGIVVDVKENVSEKLPAEFSLSQNYPNPFNPSTVIRYQLPAASHVTLKIYDVLGNEVSTLVNEFKQAGVYNSQFSTYKQGSQLSSGVYFYQLKAGNFVETKKFVLMK